MLLSVDGCSLPSTSRSTPILVDVFRLLVLALTTQHTGQIVHACQCVWMLFPQHRLKNTFTRAPTCCTQEPAF
jgi:hypothetical protein